MDNISLAQERKLVNDIVQGVEAALNELNLGSDELAQAKHAEIKLHKLLYMGVEWSDTPIQYSWHIYGPDLGKSAPEVTSVQPTAIDELPSPYTPSIESAYVNSYPSPYEYKEFYTELEVGGFHGLESVIEADIHDFLSDFYSEYAPERYKTLYLENVELQRLLWEDEESLNVLMIDEGYCRKLGGTITNLHSELLKHDEFDEVVNPFIEYTDLLEDVYTKLAISEDGDLKGDPRYIIRELSRFYHDYAWKYVAEEISRQTPHGINKNALRQGASDELQFLDESYEEFLENVKELCAEAGLLPMAGDYYNEDINSDLKNSIQELNETYDEIQMR